MKKLSKNFLTHFRGSDPVLFSVVDKLDISLELKPRIPKYYFEALTSEIISQQLSGRVSDIIFARFRKLFPTEKITAEHLVKLDHESLRSTGMSNAKAKYVKDLAEKILNKQIALNKLQELDNEDVILELTKVKGIGRWTAEMFLMFSLAREDIFSHGDLGLKNAIKKLYKLNSPTTDQIESIVKKWIPYRTYACLILWKSLEL